MDRISGEGQLKETWGPSHNSLDAKKDEHISSFF
jgi:hypothetical protein